MTCNSESGKCVCKLNVEGLKCDQCVNGTQGLSASNPDGCSICNCNSIGSINDDCDTQTGQCNCKPGVTGISCDQCIAGFYGFSESGCQTCECTNIGSESFICDVDTGICSCLDGFEGQSCDVCATGFFNFSAGCTPCKCSDDGTISGFVDDCDTIDGQCQCKDNVDGRECDSCKPNFTNLQGSNSNGCSPCDCVLNNTDTSDLLCNPVSSQCTCLPSAAGLRCDSCQDGFYSDSESCLSCDCVTNGAVNASCNSLNGQCFCVNSNIGGRTCDQCLSGHYDFPK